MVSSSSVIQILAVIMAGVVCACALPRLPQYQGNTFQDLQYRDEVQPDDPRKPVREDGLGSLLLKNLRFRDLLRNSRHAHVQPWLQNMRTAQMVESPYSREYEEPREEYRPSLSKRQMSVSQIAELLNNLKARNVDESGVKLQSLRFGK